VNNMTTDLYKVTHDFLFGSCSKEEIDFIDKYLPMDNYDCSYYVDEDVLREAVKQAEKDNFPIPQRLLEALREATKNSGSIQFCIL